MSIFKKLWDAIDPFPVEKPSVEKKLLNALPSLQPGARSDPNSIPTKQLAVSTEYKNGGGLTSGAIGPIHSGLIGGWPLFSGSVGSGQISTSYTTCGAITPERYLQSRLDGQVAETERQGAMLADLRRQTEKLAGEVRLLSQDMEKSCRAIYPTAVLSFPSKNAADPIPESEIQRIREEFEKSFSGPENKGRLFIAAPGMNLTFVPDAVKLQEQVISQQALIEQLSASVNRLTEQLECGSCPVGLSPNVHFVSILSGSMYSGLPGVINEQEQIQRLVKGMR